MEWRRHSNRAITERIIAAREANGLAKNELAERLGLTKSGYTPYERFNGVSYDGTFTVEQIFKLSRILGRSVEHFLGLDNGLTEQEDELLTLFQRLPEEGKRAILGSVRAYAEATADAGEDTGERAP